VFFVGAFAFVGTVRVLRGPDDLMRLAAWGMGAEYLGSDGVVFQNKNNNCGPAVLKMILDYHKRAVPLREIEQSVKPSEKGSSMLALKIAAESRGLHAKAWKLGLTDLARSTFPVIIFVENRHFVVIDSLSEDGFFFVRDPAIGRIKMPQRRLTKIWAGETLVLSADQRETSAFVE
jgi:ABC-type bacteriocin/lantibiotic exporter with double-glycine peptidase domain